MSNSYDNYLAKHIVEVNNAAEWLIGHFEDIAEEVKRPVDRMMLFPKHDESKYGPEEYDAYDAYFYGGDRSPAVVQNFKYAWLHHIHCNPHHWQYWVLQNDDEGEEVLEMPRRYAIEMICDWWSFSFAKDDYFEIFGWYEAHKDRMKLHPSTRKFVEELLDRIKNELMKDGDVR